MTAVVASSADHEDEDSVGLSPELVLSLLRAVASENEGGNAEEMAVRRLCLSEESDAG
jgi:hypothetical protein